MRSRRPPRRYRGARLTTCTTPARLTFLFLASLPLAVSWLRAHMRSLVVRFWCFRHLGSRLQLIPAIPANQKLQLWQTHAASLTARTS